MPTVARGLVAPLTASLSSPLLSLLADYRRLVNETLREALVSGKTARGSLSRFARDRALVHQLTGAHAVVAAEVAVALAKAHRRRIREGRRARVPYVRRAFLRTTPLTFHFDPDSGKLRLSLRRGVWDSCQVRLAPYHRERLSDPTIRVKQLHLTPERVVFTLERQVPETFAPRALLALDTNESSLDGVFLSPETGYLTRVTFPEVRRIQATHFQRRRKLAMKKATDRRVGRRLLGKEGARERHRIGSRLQDLTSRLVTVAVAQRAAIALEDLTQLPRRKRRASPALRRRLSSWPRRELHRQIAYKAADRGVPIYWVNPFRTSLTCPRCGGVTYPRSRVGPTFTCGYCEWTVDRQLNAGLNVGRTVLRDYGRGELGGLRLDLDALSQEAVRPLYPIERSAGTGGAEGREGYSRGLSEGGDS